MSEISSTSSAAWRSPLAVLELLKPITWFPPMWAFICGAVSAGGKPSGTLGHAHCRHPPCRAALALADFWERSSATARDTSCFHRPFPMRSSSRQRPRFSYTRLVWLSG